VKVVLDTNVVLSGLFFGGLPGRVLEAWRDDRFTLVLSVPIFAEYREAGAEFEAAYGGSDFEAFASLLLMNSEIVDAPEHLPERVCSDPDDEKFLTCALTAGVRIIVSGDRGLQAVTGWNDIDVVSPRRFLERYLPEST
jgi:putative PIN family toxin of toxin-antitoxin system